MLDSIGVRTNPTEADMAVGTQEKEGRLRQPRARQFQIVYGISGNHVNAKQLVEIKHFLGRRLLADDDQVELGVV